MGWLKNNFVNRGEKFIIKKTGDVPFAKKWVSKIYNFWFMVGSIIGTILVIMVVRRRAYGMIDDIGFEKAIITFVVIIAIIQIRNAKFHKAGD